MEVIASDTGPDMRQFYFLMACWHLALYVSDGYF